MRAVITILALALILVFAGWLRISSTDGDPTIRVDTDKVEQDTELIVEETKELVDRTAAKLDESFE